MTTQPVIKPEWLETIECCSAKVQMDLIRAIVTWQTDGTVPEFRSTKMAIFLLMVRDLDPKAAAFIAAASAKPSKTRTVQDGHEAEAQQEQQPADAPSEDKPEPDSSTETAPATPHKRKDPRRYFFPNGPLY